VHSRDAAQDTFDLIRAEHAGTTGGIIHCYSGSAEMAKEYIKMGYHLGIGGVVTFKNAKTLQRVVAETPIERLVTETDCPYLAPSPYRGKRNFSGYISYVIAAIARIKEMDEEDAARILLENARKVYRIR
jgi:TatD DNase family protein